jgi:hypothetical protein
MYAHRLADKERADSDPTTAQRMRRPDHARAWPATQDMEVMWTNRTNDWNRRHMYAGVGCRQIDGSVSNWILRVFWRDGRDPSKMRQDCPPTDTLLARFVHLDSTAPDVVSRLKDRYVFYGSSLVALGDIVNPPTHTRMPAVYLHAMAFQNLQHYGLDYKHVDIGLGHGVILPSSVLDQIFTVVVTCAGLWFARARQRARICGPAALPPREERRRNPPAALRRRYWRSVGLATGLYMALFALLFAGSKAGGWTMTLAALALLGTLDAIAAGWPMWAARSPVRLRLYYGTAGALLLAACAACALALASGQVTQTDIALALGLAAAACMVADICHRARRYSPVTHEAESGDLREAEEWLFLRRVWQRKRDWWFFLGAMTALLLAVTLVLFAWHGISIRNWIGTVLLTLVLGGAYFEFWIERGIAFWDWKFGKALRSWAFLTQAEVVRSG